MNLYLNVDNDDIPNCLLPFLQRDINQMAIQYIGSKDTPILRAQLQGMADGIAQGYQRQPTIEEFASATQTFLEKLGVCSQAEL